MVDLILGIVGGLLYPLFSIIFLLIDVLQGIFFALAGIGNVRYSGIGDADVNASWGSNITSTNGGNKTDSGLIFYLLNTSIVKNLLMSITILALFLLILFTVMAFIKNAYTAKPKGWQDIIASALKGLLSFVAIPVFCLLGVWVSNIVLQAVNGATSSGGGTQMSRKLFICAAYNANSWRLSEGTPDTDDYDRVDRIISWAGMKNQITLSKNESADELARIVDQCYESGSISIYEWVSVEQGYALYSINYLVLIVGGIFMLYVLVTLAYAMVRRMFMLCMLFVISPAICAMYPLDDGSAVGQWRKQFISNTIGAYGAVAGMNLFFSLLPIVNNLNFLWFTAGIAGTDDISYIIQILIMTCGLFVVKELISTISSMIGGDDAYAKGSSLRASTTKAVRKYGNTVIAGAFTMNRAAKEERDKHTSPLGKFGGGLWGATKTGAGFLLSSLGAMTGGKDGLKETIKTAKDMNDKRVKDAETKEVYKELQQILSDIATRDAKGKVTGYGKTTKAYAHIGAGASLDDVLKLADKFGLKEKAAAKAGVDLKHVEEMKEIMKPVNDAAKAYLQVTEELRALADDLGKIKTGSPLHNKSVADISKMSVTEARDEGERELIREAKRLMRQESTTRTQYDDAVTKANKFVTTGDTAGLGTLLTNMTVSMDAAKAGFENRSKDTSVVTTLMAAMEKAAAEVVAYSGNGKVVYHDKDGKKEDKDTVQGVSQIVGAETNKIVKALDKLTHTAASRAVTKITTDATGGGKK